VSLKPPFEKLWEQLQRARDVFIFTTARFDEVTQSAKVQDAFKPFTISDIACLKAVAGAP
jgi:hypothetical protein